MNWEVGIGLLCQKVSHFRRCKKRTGRENGVFLGVSWFFWTIPHLGGTFAVHFSTNNYQSNIKHSRHAWQLGKANLRKTPPKKLQDRTSESPLPSHPTTMCFKGGAASDQIGLVYWDWWFASGVTSTPRLIPQIEVLFQRTQLTIIENPTLPKQPNLETILSTPKKKLNNCRMFILYLLRGWLLYSRWRIATSFLSTCSIPLKRDVASAVFR